MPSPKMLFNLLLDAVSSQEQVRVPEPAVPVSVMSPDVVASTIVTIVV